MSRMVCKVMSVETPGTPGAQEAVLQAHVQDQLERGWTLRAAVPWRNGGGVQLIFVMKVRG